MSHRMIMDWVTMAMTVVAIIATIYFIIRSVRSRGIGWVFADRSDEPMWRTALYALLLVLSGMVIPAAAILIVGFGCGSPTRMWQEHVYNLQQQVETKPIQIYQPCTADSPGLRAKFRSVVQQHAKRTKTSRLEAKKLREKAAKEFQFTKFRRLKLPATLPLPTAPVYDWCSKFSHTDWELKAVVSAGRCRLVSVKYDNKLELTEIKGQDWGVVAGIFSLSLANSGAMVSDCGDDCLATINLADADEKYIRQVEAMEYFPNELTGLKCFGDLQKYFKGVVESEWQLRELGRLAPFANILLSSKAKVVAREWLVDYWKASYYNMAKLEAAIKGYDESYYSYLYWKNLKLEGWFMRRWINAGRGKRGNDHLALLRFWMWRLAKELKHPQASKWRRQVQSEMGKASTLAYRNQYLKQLE